MRLPCSPTLAAAYYRWRLGQEAFSPNRYVWWQTNPGETPAHAPLPVGVRLIALAAVAVAAGFGDGRARFAVATMAVTSFAFPQEYFGFLRYVPWTCLAPILAVCAMGRLSVRLVRPGVVDACALLVAGGMAVPSVFHGALAIENGWAMRRLLVEDPPRTLRCCLYTGEMAERFLAGRHALDWETFGHPSDIVMLNLRLLAREEPALWGARVARLAPEETAAWRNGPSGEFFLPKGYDLARWSFNDKVRRLPSRGVRFLAYPLVVAHAYGVILPRMLWARVRGL